jgi:hypothetical protein
MTVQTEDVDGKKELLRQIKAVVRSIEDGKREAREFDPAKLPADRQELLDVLSWRGVIAPPEYPKVVFKMTSPKRETIEANSRDISSESVLSYLEHEHGLKDLELKWLGDGHGALYHDGKEVGSFTADMSTIFPPGGAAIIDAPKDDDLVGAFRL